MTCRFALLADIPTHNKLSTQKEPFAADLAFDNIYKLPAHKEFLLNTIKQRVIHKCI